MTDAEKAVNVKNIGNRRSVADDVLRGSLLFAYVDNRSANAVKDRRLAFEFAAAAFRREALSALTVKPISAKSDEADRYEQIQPFIVKLLLYIGKIPTESSFVVAARVIEECVLHTETDVMDIIKQLAASIGSTFATVKRLAEGSIAWYDCNVAERIKYLTGTEPFNALDALCDIAVYVRMKISEVNVNE